MKNPIFQELAQAAREGEPVALGIISGVKGSSPQKVGAKAIFYLDGRIKGTMGGGCLEAEIQQRAIQSLRSGKASTFDLLLDHDFGWDDGLICGGKVFGVILPNAQNAGENLWRELAERNSTLTWGVKQDFSIAMASQVSDIATRVEKPLKRLEASPAYAITPLKQGVNETRKQAGVDAAMLPQLST